MFLLKIIIYSFALYSVQHSTVQAVVFSRRIRRRHVDQIMWSNPLNNMLKLLSLSNPITSDILRKQGFDCYNISQNNRVSSCNLNCYPPLFPISKPFLLGYYLDDLNNYCSNTLYPERAAMYCYAYMYLSTAKLLI